MIFKNYLFLFFFFFIINNFSAQSIPSNFRFPLDGMPIITGNFGEIRPNHFHAGFDLRTDAKKNLPIYCVDSGYVSRIKVSAFGYGKVLYITHPNGYVSVYAHSIILQIKFKNTFAPSKKKKKHLNLKCF